ncbi:MAG: type II secretion system F family protein, partial [Candidatus Omnitrophica bacterium]|nr:type II secretion system F family protein [Candidatus Omnitrophota bacterium]
IEEMRADVKSGATFNRAIAKQPKHFPVFWAPVVEAGEESGNLTRVLNQLGKSLEASIGFKRKIVSAMFYPCVIIGVAIVAVLVFLLKIIPIFSRVYASFNAELPFFTRVVLGVSEGLQRFFFIWAAGITLAVYLFRLFLKTPRGRAWFDHWILGVPLVGEIMKDAIHVRTALILSTLLEGGLNLMKTLDIAARVSGNVVYGEALRKIITEVQQGKSLGASFSKSPHFSHMMGEMITIGEESGKLASMLEKAGNHHETRIDTTVARIGSLIEPAIIIVVGAVIGCLVVSMFLPIFNLANIVQ